MKAKNYRRINFEPKLFGMTIHEVLILGGTIAMLSFLQIDGVVTLCIGLSLALVHKNYKDKLRKKIKKTTTKERTLLAGKKEKGMLFPILNAEGNKLVTNKGECSWVWEMFPPDLEQVTEAQRENTLSQLKTELNLLQEGTWLRIEKREGRYFLNSNKKDIELTNFVFRPVEDALSSFFEGELLGDIVMQSDRITYNDTDRSFFPIKELPENIFDNLLVRTGENFSLVLRKENPSKSMISIDRKRKQIHSGQDSGPADYKELEGGRHLELLKKDIDEGLESLWSCSITFVSETHSEDRRVFANKRLRSILDKEGLVQHDSSFELKEIFEDYLWGTTPKLKNFKISTGATTSVATCLIPSSQDMLMHDGFSLYSNGETDGTVHPLKYRFDHEALNNGHVYVAGTTGSGKSLFVQSTVDYYIDQGSSVVILDKGRSFEKLALYYDGHYLNEKINFLEFKDASYLTELVLSLMDTDSITKEEQALIYTAVKDALSKNKTNSHKEFFGHLETFRKGIKNYFSEFEEICTDEKSEKSHRLVFCEIEKINSKFHGAVVLYLFELFLKIEGHKLFVFEEIHNLLKTQGVRISNYFREQRKKGATCISITQSVNDNNKHNLMDVIWQCTEHKVIFKHEDDIKDEYLNANQRELFNKMRNQELGHVNKHNNEEKKNYSEMIISCSLFCKRVRLYVDPLEYALYTTSAKDLDRFRRWTNRNIELYTSEEGTDFKKMISVYAEMVKCESYL